MKKRASILLNIFMFFLAFPLWGLDQDALASQEVCLRQSSEDYQRDFYCKVMKNSYGKYIKNCKDNQLVFKNGSSIALLEEKDSSPSIENLFDPAYQLYNSHIVSDGGRYRLYSLFSLVYGKSYKKIRSNLVRVTFLGQKVKFNKHNGASLALKAVSRDLYKLEKKTKLNTQYISKAETFSYRKIGHSLKLSAHSYGIAIDLNPAFNRGYWGWLDKYVIFIDKRPFLNFPDKVISIFEKHGFVWGGRWIHFDQMHFEYRPEFLAYRKALSELGCF